MHPELESENLLLSKRNELKIRLQDLIDSELWVDASNLLIDLNIIDNEFRIMKRLASEKPDKLIMNDH